MVCVLHLEGLKHPDCVLVCLFIVLDFLYEHFITNLFACGEKSEEFSTRFVLGLDFLMVMDE